MPIFETQKCSRAYAIELHMLDFILDSIREAGCVKYLHAEIFESAHRMDQETIREKLAKKKVCTRKKMGRTIAVASLHQVEDRKLSSDDKNLQSVAASRGAPNEVCSYQGEDQLYSF